MGNRHPTSSTTYGLYAGEKVEANTININVNSSSARTSQPTRKTTFRCNVPTPTKHYKGRMDTLRELQQFYALLPKKSRNYSERIVAIVGLGGMGKTETASMYAAKHRKTFPNAAWINAETEQGMLNSFLDLANELGIAKDDQKCSDLSLVKKVYRFIDNNYHSNALFIFDNAIGLSSDDAEVGILDFLPTDDLPNQRFPNILITTQTPDWGRQIKTLQVEGLREEEALEFYASCFKVKPSECTKEFKMLNDLLKGYPLCMNLAVSTIDFVPGKDSVCHLKQEIKLYVDKVSTEQKRLTTEKIKPAWGHKYDKTLSTVWQLTQERIQKMDDGPEALEILQIMSFLRLPVKSETVGLILESNTPCPHPKVDDIEIRLKKLLRVLEKLYVVRVESNPWISYLEIHRLVQLVVRDQTNCNQALATVLRYVASATDCKISKIDMYSVNLSDLEETLENPRTQLSSPALLYVAILAYKDNRTARNFFETRRPETEAVATFWRLVSLMTRTTTSDVIAHQVIRELVGLTTSSERMVDRRFFAAITLALAHPDILPIFGYDYYEIWKHLYSLNLNLDSMDDIQDLTVELVLNICSIQDSRCERYCCRDTSRPVYQLINKLVMGFVRLDALEPKSVVAVERLAATWLAFIAKQRDYEALRFSYWASFWCNIYRTFESPDACPLRIAELRTCLWDRGLADELIQTFKSLKYAENGLYLSLAECIDVCLDGVHLLDMRGQQVISAFTEATTNCYLQVINSTVVSYRDRQEILYQVYMVWIKVLLMDGDPTSAILECLLHCKPLNTLKGTPEGRIRDIDITQAIRYRNRIYLKYRSEYFGEFIRRYSSYKVGPIHALCAFCEIALNIPME